MGLFKKNRSSKSSSLRQRSRRFETLEDRRLMAIDFSNSVFDPMVFGNNMEAIFGPNAVGYGYAVNYQGQTNAWYGGGGDARTIADSFPALGFDENTEMEIASVSKPITAVAVIRLLESLTQGDNPRFASLDEALESKLTEYLPSDWEPGINLNWISLRHLLTHTSGFNEETNGAGINFESFGNNTWANLKNLVESGLPAPDIDADPSGGAFDDSPRWSANIGGYNNANFTLLAKVVIPKLLNEGASFSAAALAAQGIDQTEVDSHTGGIYTLYVQESVFAPLGLYDVSMNLDGTPVDDVLAYNSTEPVWSTNGSAMSDLLNTGGAFGWKMAASELATFLRGVKYSPGYLSPEARDMMFEQGLGWSTGNDTWGISYGHGGLSAINTKRFVSQVGLLPGDVELAVLMNSQDGVLPYGEFKNGVWKGDIAAAAKEAYHQAWTDITYEGTSGKDNFTITVNNSGDQPMVELWRGSTLILSQWASTLESLTINGLGGDDTFEVESLPDSVELVINGGGNNDSVFVTSTDRNLDAVRNLTFNGGAGVDSLEVNDQNNPYDIDLNYRYNVTSNSLWRGAESIDPTNSVGEVRVNYGGVEHLALTTGDEAEDVFVEGTASFSTTINSGGGGDTLFCSGFGGSMDLVDGLQFNGGTGTDSVIINDTNNPYSTSSNNQYEVSSSGVSRYGGATVLDIVVSRTIGFGDVENLTLYTGDQGDIVDVESTTSGETVIETGGGSDTLHVAPEAGNMALADGLTYNAGTGNNSLVIHDENNPYGLLINEPYSVTPVSVSRNAAYPGLPVFGLPASVNYYGVATLELTTGDEADIVEVHGLKLLGSSSTIAATINTGEGDDTLVVTPDDGNMEYVDGLQYNGGDDSDSVIVHDENNPYSHVASDDYAVNSNAVSRWAQDPVASQWPTSIAIGINGVEDVELHAGAQGDTISVSSTASLETVSIYGGNPNRAPGDTLELSAPAGAVTGWLPSTTEYGAGQAVIDDAMISYWEIETVDSDFPTPNPENDAFGDFDGNGVVNGDDLTHPLLGYRARYGESLNGRHFLTWQRHFGQKVPDGNKLAPLVVQDPVPTQVNAFAMPATFPELSLDDVEPQVAPIDLVIEAGFLGTFETEEVEEEEAENLLTNEGDDYALQAATTRHSHWFWPRVGEEVIVASSQEVTERELDLVFSMADFDELGEYAF